MKKSIHERIKQLRKEELKMTQIDFGKRLNSAGSTVVGWEKGDRTPPESTLKLICKEFNVNYDWLVDGKGVIFIDTDRTTIELLADDYKLRPVEVSLIEEFVKLDEEERNVLLNYLQNVFLKNGQ